MTTVKEVNFKVREVKICDGVYCTKIIGQGEKSYDIDKLRDCEWNVLLLMAKGYSNKKIAEKLFNSEKTIACHVSDIFSKLQVHNRNECILTLLKDGILNIEDLKDGK